jgi:subtilisin family serine protease
VAVGFSIIDSGALAGLGVTFHRLEIAPGLDLPTALAQVRALPTGQISDVNHFYRTEQALPDCNAAQCAAVRQIGWPDPRDCTPAASIGIIDTPVNMDHALLAEARIETLRTASQDTDPASVMHGTAVAALLVAAPDRGFKGLVPTAPVIAVDAFHKVGRDERADTLALIRGLSVMSDRGVKTINLSLAGPANVLLETAVDRLAKNDVLLVAAAGNGGPGAPAAFPGAYPSVVAVTAVDGEDRIFRRAQRGAHVEFAAPGVDVWTAASISGLRRKSGTSFAVPFVTAALAQARADAPGLPASAIRRTLGDQARDLGEPGPDPIFGQGLLSARGLCGTARFLPASAPAGTETVSPSAPD